ncbi:MAG TPA: hypothetical protein VGQ36_05770 [Thermoanaerobaculia bacterium]|jgi:hypothetical protein|nr:hypothetical protein [Thermoanaerobaculia bacterium]
MLISDEFTVPYQSLADWAALTSSAVIYVAWAALVLYWARTFARRTKMRMLSALLTVVLLSIGLLGYGLLFVQLEQLAFGIAVRAAFPEPISPAADLLLADLVSERGWAFIRSPQAFGMRGFAFYALPFLGIAGVLMRARTRS